MTILCPDQTCADYNENRCCSVNHHCFFDVSSAIANPGTIMSGKVGQVGKVIPRVQFRVVLSVLVCGFAFKMFFHDKHDCATERTLRTPSKRIFFDSAPPPEFYVVHRIDEAGM